MMDVKRFLDRGGAGSKILRAGRGNSQTWYILTRGGAFLKKILSPGQSGAAIFPRAGACIPDIQKFWVTRWKNEN